MTLEQLTGSVQPADERAYQLCQRRWNAVAKPVGSLGKMEELLCRIAAISRTPAIQIEKKCVLVFCGDNGVLAQGVAQSTSEVTTAIARSLAAETTSVNTMAKACGARVFPVDMGMVDDVPGLLERKLGHGTQDISQGPAMTREQAMQGIMTGIQLVKDRVEEGYQVIGTGEAGIGNTTTSSAMTAVLLGQPVDVVTGRGSGLTDEGLERKRKAITSAIACNHPDPQDPVDILAKVGGFDLAGMVGAFLGGAIYHVPVVIDGFISAVAALCATRICPLAVEYMLPSHISAEPAGRMLMEQLGFHPMIDGGLRLGEGTGGVALFPLLDMAAAVYHHAASFEDIQVEAYEPWEK